MKIYKTELPGVQIIEPDVYGDGRGYFMEAYNLKKYRDIGIGNFLQDNISMTRHGCLRGLHYQYPEGQGKLIWVVEGAVFDVAVDIRRGSPMFGQWVGTELSSENKRQVWISPGFAHGFCVLSESAIFMYKCTNYYAPYCEHTILWNDPAINIKWPVESPILSEKDKTGQLLKEINPQHLPQFSE